MDKRIAAYHLSKIQVQITETSDEDELLVDCNDGTYHSAFTVRRFEYENYKRHMNQRIKNAFDKQYEVED
jgi:hypothetical protein